MKNTVNAYEFFKDFDYKGYFSTHFRYMLNPMAHVNERLLNNGKQKTLDVVPKHLINRLENKVLTSKKNLRCTSSNLSLNHSISVLHTDLLERIK